MEKFISSIILSISMLSLFAQTGRLDAENDTTEYRRSSLCLIMIDENQMPKRDTISDAFLSTPIPDKYNDHNIGNRIFNVDEMAATDEDITVFRTAVNYGKIAERTAAAKENVISEDKKNKAKNNGGFKRFMSEFAKVAIAVATESNTSVIDTSNKEDIAALAYRYLCENDIAYQMARKWFETQDGRDTMLLVQQRGLYDASVIDIQNAERTVRGLNILRDAGEELIKNSFVVVSRYRYISKDELVAEIDATAQLIADQFGGYANLAASAATLTLKASLGAGYYVRTTSYLFQLDWNEEISNKIYSEMWNKPQVWEENKNLFRLNYIGEEYAWANVKAGIFTKKKESELIYDATINAMDNVLAKLERKYEVFKTKTPLYVTEEGGDIKIAAKIGLKEGLQGGDKFEVLERLADENSRTYYKRIGIVEVDKNQIWDNRFMADEERKLTGDIQGFNETLFIGGKTKYYPGLLLRQIK